MGRYYWNLVRDIPTVFRHTVEAWIFWIVGGFALIATVAGLFGWTVDKVPAWLAPAGVGVAVVYAILRTNYHRVDRLQATINKAKQDDDDTFNQLCQTLEHAEMLAVGSEKAKLDTPEKVAQWIEIVEGFCNGEVRAVASLLDRDEQIALRTYERVNTSWVHAATPEHGQAHFKLRAVRTVLKELVRARKELRIRRQLAP